MNISPVGSAASSVAAVRPQTPPPAARPTAPVVVGSDSDGDNDGSKGSTVDVRA
jgi:hypothetical protein